VGGGPIYWRIVPRSFSFLIKISVSILLAVFFEYQMLHDWETILSRSVVYLVYKKNAPQVKGEQFKIQHVSLISRSYEQNT